MNLTPVSQAFRPDINRFGAIRIETKHAVVSGILVTDDDASPSQNRLLINQKPLISDIRIGTFIADLKDGKYTPETARTHLKALMTSFDISEKSQLKPEDLTPLERENYSRSIAEFKHARPEIDHLLANHHMELAKPGKAGQPVGQILLTLA